MINDILQEIQSDLKAPKNQRNTFGNYNYRSCEDILEALKPLLKPHKATITLTDTVAEVGNRVYVMAIAKLSASGESVEATGWAREEETKKGMDASQITGAASSYARKYALNGLFAIDDTKDADAQETDKKADTRDAPKTAKQDTPKADAKDKTETINKLLTQFATLRGKTKDEVRAVSWDKLGFAPFDEVGNLSEADKDRVINQLNTWIKKAKT